jgi:hypothetical protein
VSSARELTIPRYQDTAAEVVVPPAEREGSANLMRSTTSTTSSQNGVY